MSRASWALALLLAIVGSTPSEAQILMEKKFLEDSLKSHPGVAVAEADVAAAAGVSRQTGVVDNPEITWEREDPDGAPRQDTWRLSWRLPFDGRRHRMAAGEAAVAASVSEVEAARLTARLEMRSLYASWYMAAEREKVLLANLDRTRRLATWLRARAEEGEAAGVEARRLDLEVEVLQRNAGAARAEAQARREAAAVWSNLVTGQVTPARPTLPAPPDTADVGDRADLKALAHRVALAESVTQVRRRVVEPPEISVGWLEIRDGLQSFDGPVFGVTWPVPLFDRNQGTREAADAGLERANSELELSRRRAEQHLQAALASYSELFEIVMNGDHQTAHDDVLDAVFAAFEAGEASLTDMLDALRATVGVEMARLETLARALRAHLELEAALGRPVFSGENS